MARLSAETLVQPWDTFTFALCEGGNAHWERGNPAPELLLRTVWKDRGLKLRLLYSTDGGEWDGSLELDLHSW